MSDEVAFDTVFSKKFYNLLQKVSARMTSMSDEKPVALAEVIRRSVALLAYLLKQLENDPGAKIFIKKSDGSQEDITQLFSSGKL